jgi:hypothetical protein
MVEDAIAAGILRLLKIQWLRMALKTLHCFYLF